MTLATRRIGTDWGALCRAELEGREVPGSVGRLLAEALGHKPEPEADIGDTAKQLAKLAELLKSPADLKKQIAELDRAAQASRAAADAVKAEQAKLDKAKEDLAAERAKHEAAIAHEVKEHQAALAAGHSELESVKKVAADLKAKAEADLTVAAELKAKFEKKLALITAD
jgi:hypothetical protein